MCHIPSLNIWYITRVLLCTCYVVGCKRVICSGSCCFFFHVSRGLRFDYSLTALPLTGAHCICWCIVQERQSYSACYCHTTVVQDRGRMDRWRIWETDLPSQRMVCMWGCVQVAFSPYSASDVPNTHWYCTILLCRAVALWLLVLCT